MDQFPPNVESLISHRATELRGSREFVTKFVRLYVPSRSSTPPFYIGKLEGAIKLAWDRPAEEVRLLVMYIHKQGSRSSEQFSKIFRSQTVQELLLTQCILWGWDVTLDVNKETLLGIVSFNLGFENSVRLRSLTKKMYPCMLLLAKPYRASGVEVVQFLKAHDDPRFTISLFQDAVRVFTTVVRPILIAKEVGIQGGAVDEQIKRVEPSGKETSALNPVQQLAKIRQQQASDTAEARKEIFEPLAKKKPHLRPFLTSPSYQRPTDEVAKTYFRRNKKEKRNSGGSENRLTIRNEEVDEREKAKKKRSVASREKLEAENILMRSRAFEEEFENKVFRSSVSIKSAVNGEKLATTSSLAAAKLRPNRSEKELTITIKFNSKN